VTIKPFNKDDLDMSKLASFPGTPAYVDEIIDASQIDVQSLNAHEPEGVVIAGESMLRAAGHRPGDSGPSGWSRAPSGAFKKPARDGNTVLWVQQCCNFWIIERSTRLDSADIRTLVCMFSKRPIWTRTRVAAMRLAERCDPFPLPPVAGYWAELNSYVGLNRAVDELLPHPAAQVP
jgi:hypothetical protein